MGKKKPPSPTRKKGITSRDRAFGRQVAKDDKRCMGCGRKTRLNSFHRCDDCQKKKGKQHGGS